MDELFPEITVETDDVILIIAVKKDYSQNNDLIQRKKEFINDLNNVIDEFDKTTEIKDFLSFFD